MGATLKTLSVVTIAIWYGVGLWLTVPGAFAAERAEYAPLAQAVIGALSGNPDVPNATSSTTPSIAERQRRGASPQETSVYVPLGGFGVVIPRAGTAPLPAGTPRVAQDEPRPDLPFRWDPAQAPPTVTLSTRAGPAIRRQPSGPMPPGAMVSGVHGLRSLIGWAEAGRAGYDAVVLSARVKPDKPPTEMTIHEIFLWIERTPRQNHAIGRYQFIPATLDRLVRKLDVSRSQLFDPDLQDRLANALMVEAGLSDFMRGDLSRTGFMNELAAIWAGLPTSGGKSRYHGIAGNKAVITWQRFAQAMEVYFPM